MTNKEFDQWLRESLSSVRPEINPQDWDHFVHQVEESESELDFGFDDAVRNAVMIPFVSSDPDWQQMEQRLDEDERRFDQHVKQNIERFEVPYNPTTWPTLHEKLSEEERLRRRFLYVKLLEIAAIFIVFLTFYNFFPALKTSVIKPAEELIRKEILNKEQKEPALTLSSDTPTDARAAEHVVASGTLTPAQPVNPGSVSASSGATHLQLQIVQSAVPDSDDPIVLGNQSITSRPLIAPGSKESGTSEPNHTSVAGRLVLPDASPLAALRNSFLPVNHLAPVLNSLLLSGTSANHLSRVRFGMMASADVNTLFFPEEHFYSQGRSIHFSEKEIVAGGYSAGASLLFDLKNIMIETGLTYSSKTFGPDRNLFIGTSSDRHSLDFENISLSIVSLPLYLHWKIDGKGLWRVYATGGASMHVIANANYDLIAENLYTSSAVQSGQQLQNEREVQRVREHMLDGAKFSSKGYLTASGGLGLERYLNTRLSVFVQPMYQYQIPFFGLIDQNGKHLQNGSILLGTRISL